MHSTNVENKKRIEIKQTDSSQAKLGQAIAKFYNRHTLDVYTQTLGKRKMMMRKKERKKTSFGEQSWFTMPSKAASRRTFERNILPNKYISVCTIVQFSAMHTHTHMHSEEITGATQIALFSLMPIFRCVSRRSQPIQNLS